MTIYLPAAESPILALTAYRRGRGMTRCGISSIEGLRTLTASIISSRPLFGSSQVYPNPVASGGIFLATGNSAAS
ncbi:MAG: hypothetical protein DMF75_15735 [Acidobacteria bacterium]|nr:MAG: hypothetical protein DMF75_15735 [Acidobacteriota bacterium]